MAVDAQSGRVPMLGGAEQMPTGTFAIGPTVCAFEGIELLIATSCRDEHPSPARHRRVGRTNKAIRCAGGARYSTRERRRRAKKSAGYGESLACRRPQEILRRRAGSASGFCGYRACSTRQASECRLRCNHYRR